MTDPSSPTSSLPHAQQGRQIQGSQIVQPERPLSLFVCPGVSFKRQDMSREIVDLPEFKPITVSHSTLMLATGSIEVLEEREADGLRCSP